MPAGALADSLGLHLCFLLFLALSAMPALHHGLAVSVWDVWHTRLFSDCLPGATLPEKRILRMT